MKIAEETSNLGSFNVRYPEIPFPNQWEVDESQNSIKLFESFFRSPQYQKIYLNFDYSQEYHVWIGEGNYEFKQVGYMRMLSFPYKEFKFDIGDYITCIYDGVETTWIIKTITKSHLYECIAHIEKTNNYLRWTDKYGNLIEYRCVVSDKMLEAFPGRSIIVHPEGNIFLDVRRDLITSTIKENQKFIFGGLASAKIQGQIYRVYSFKNFMNDETTNEAILSLELRRENADDSDVDNPKDDLFNNIPDVYISNLYSLVINSLDIEQTVGFKKDLSATVFYDENQTDYDVIWNSSNSNVVSIDENGHMEILDYGKVVITATFSKNKSIYSSIIVNSVETMKEVSYYKITPFDIDVILQGDSQTFEVYKYVNHERVEETFSITFENVPNEGKYENYFYEVDVVGGDLDNCNVFSIKNIRSFNVSNLGINIISNLTGENVFSSSLRLGGLI